MRLKSITFFILIYVSLMLFFGCTTNRPLKTMFEATIKMYEGDSLKDAYIIATISENKFNVYDFDIVESINGKYLFKPILANGQQIALNPSNPKYSSVLSELFMANCGDRKTNYKFYVENASGKNNFVNYVIVLNSNPYTKEDTINKISIGTGLMGSENIDFNMKLNLSQFSEFKDIRCNSLSIVDDKFNLEYWEDNGNGIELVDQRKIDIAKYNPRNKLESDAISGVIQKIKYR